MALPSHVRKNSPTPTGVRRELACPSTASHETRTWALASRTSVTRQTHATRKNIENDIAWEYFEKALGRIHKLRRKSAPPDHWTSNMVAGPTKGTPRRRSQREVVARVEVDHQKTCTRLKPHKKTRPLRAEVWSRVGAEGHIQ